MGGSLINKFADSAAEAVKDIKDGAVVLVGGFSSVGLPLQLLDALVDQGARNLTVVANNAGAYRLGISRLLDMGRVGKVICSFPRSATTTSFEDLYMAGKVDLEIVPQGTLAERLRAAGAGVGAFYTPTAYGTELAEGKETREINGKMQVLEYALHGDLALIEAWQGDRWGNLTYRRSGRNFNPVMATAAKLTVAQVQHVAELGDLDPEQIVTPGIYVHRLVHIPYGGPTVRSDK